MSSVGEASSTKCETSRSAQEVGIGDATAEGSETNLDSDWSE